MRTPRIDRSGTPGGRRGIVLFVAAALASVLAVGGIHAALAGGSSKVRTRPTLAQDQPVAPSVVTDPVPSVTPAEESPSAEPAPDPNALADGVYPTFVRAVDVQGGTVTVDVLQLFLGGAAHQAAIEDGMSWQDAQYTYTYIRNENPLIRTLPVIRDVQIKFIGMCMSPSRYVGLTQLRKETADFDELFYYDVTVVDGSIERIMQRVSVEGC